MKTLNLNLGQEQPFATREALNRLRINFGFCGSQYKLVTVTSSFENEGKSFISTNLWKLLGEAGYKVCLVDADLRKTVMQSKLQMRCSDDNFLSLPHYLSGQAKLEDVVYETNYTNCYMVPCTITVSNPSLLLQSELFLEMLSSLKDKFDYVLIDTPPIGSVADGDLIASHCDGAVLAVRSGMIPKEAVAASMKQLERAGCKLMGVVLTRAQLAGSKYGYGKYGHYGKYGNYGYGYGYGNGYGYGQDGKSGKSEKDKKEKK